MTALTSCNTFALYSLFIEPILQHTVMAALCTPAFLLPSILINYFYLGEYSIMFYAKRDMVINMWLLPQGKQVIVENYNGDTRKINIKDFYKYENRKTKLKLGNRIEMYHGANNYLFLSGNPHYIDHEVLESIMKRNFVDTKNVTFDIDNDKSFTWEIDQLMRSDIQRYHKRMSFKYKNPLTEEEKTNKIKKLNAIYKLRKNLKNSKMARGLNHNFYRTMKTYSATKKWADFNLAKLQGTLINFTEDMETIEVFHDFKPHPDDQKKLDQKNVEEQEFLNKRKYLLRRSRKYLSCK